MEKDVEKLLTKGKINLMTKSVFLSTIALRMKQVITTDVPTAATDGMHVYYNPNFVSNLNVEETTGLIAHECWHVALLHMTRRGERDPRIWNYAGDYVLNGFMVKDRMVLPRGALIDHKYDGMTTEQVYELLDKEMDNPEFEDIIYDGPGNKELSKEEIEEIKGIVVAAQTQSKLAGRASGEIPTEVARNIDELINPVIPWRILLYKFMNNRSKDLFSWSRRNRRYSEYLPSLYSENLSHLYFAIDTSGSVSKDELIELLSEIKSIKDTFNPSKMTIIDCDSHIHNVHEIDANTDILSLKFNGGGGTRFTPVLEYLEDKQPEALIYFTDLYGENSLNPVNYPILWICNSEHPPMNIGETIYFK